MSNKTHSETSERMAVSATQAAKLCGVSVRHWWSLNSRGAIPAPVRLGAATRWRLADLNDWLALNCPNRKQFEELQAAQTGKGAGK